MTTQKAVLVVGSLLVLVGLSFVVPAKYVGIQSKKTPLVLKTAEDFAALKEDRNGNRVPDWKDLVIDQSAVAMGNNITITPAVPTPFSNFPAL